MEGLGGRPGWKASVEGLDGRPGWKSRLGFKTFLETKKSWDRCMQQCFAGNFWVPEKKRNDCED